MNFRETKSSLRVPLLRSGIAGGGVPNHSVNNQVITWLFCLLWVLIADHSTMKLSSIGASEMIFIARQGFVLLVILVPYDIQFVLRES